jgi:DNA-binding GntR family transcriptional regulator
MDLTYAIRGPAFTDPENLETSRRHHRIMLNLLAGTDAWALAEICVDHIQRTKAHYLAVLRDQLDCASRPDGSTSAPFPIDI